ncbi:MAG: LysE family translocator [Rikenellaceae bacterium]
MFTDFTAFMLFVIVTTFTPGPNNITSLTFCLNQGYAKTVPYMLGIISGLFVVQLSLATALFSVSSSSIAEVVGWMKYLGAAYILYLAFKTFSININWNESNPLTKSHFFDGFIFQAINPKVYFFSVTFLTTFINYDSVSYLQLTLLALALCALTFVAVSLWGVVGAVIKRVFDNNLYTRIFGAIMSLSLVYTAYLILK